MQFITIFRNLQSRLRLMRRLMGVAFLFAFFYPPLVLAASLTQKQASPTLYSAQVNLPAGQGELTDNRTMRRDVPQSIKGTLLQISATTLAGTPESNSAVPVLAKEGTSWTLADSVRRAFDIAPELRAAEAVIAARGGDLSQAGAWTNPTIEVRADNRLGMEDGRGGADITQIAFSQPIPIRRLAHQQNAAQASLESAQANRNAQRLLLEREVARLYHALQLAAAKRQLAEERQQLVAESLNASRKPGTDRLVRYLTPLERRRLSILSEEANQTVAVAEREQQKALLDFRALLALPNGTRIEPVALTLPVASASLATLTRALDEHPALVAARKEADAMQSGIAVAESQRLADPVLTVYREGGYIAGERRDATGVGLSVQIPFWSSSGMVVRARAESDRAQAQLAVAQRDSHSRLELAYTQRLFLIEQSERLRTNLLEPAREMFALTRSSFAAGELNLLTLVDANNTYFDALERYLELQHESALAAADLRLASGVSLLESSKGITP
ncbi:MAG TPA: TolC family protein [Gallionellaceae bacterium]|nr:TolC family protein [Gallionellaceae bacterium]HQS75111.1 TolC family protein [Gallionellaceae bacterium]